MNSRKNNLLLVSAPFSSLNYLDKNNEETDVPYFLDSKRVFQKEEILPLSAKKLFKN